MLETFFCMPNECISRADVFCTTFIAGFVLFSLGLALSWPYLIASNFMGKIKGKVENNH